MNRLQLLCPIGILLLALAFDRAQAQPRALHLALQTREPKNNQVVITMEEVDSAKVAVVIIDPWNFHWCMTGCERVAAMVPRWNRAVECARKLGMPILWAPSNTAPNYAGYPQRERALAVPWVPVPKLRELPLSHFTAPVGPCMCGPGIHCVVNYGWDGIEPDLGVADEDLIVSYSTEEVYSLLRQRGITHVIYMGLHTNMCLYGNRGALKTMFEAGLKCVLARDINDAFTSYNPKTGYTPDQGTRQTDEDLERAGVATINVVEEWRKAGVWNDQWVVETVRITPWGKRLRPYFFEQPTVVTLTTPLLEKVQIRYTLDGSEPGPSAARYEQPIQLTETAELRAAAFRDGVRVSVPTSAYFARLPAQPPKPDVYLDELKYELDPYVRSRPDLAALLPMPKVGKSFEGQPLRIRGKTYTKGLGFRAPGGMRYELKPEYDRFVGLAGMADDILDRAPIGLAMHGSVLFRVFIDGQTLAESPVMRVSQEPWRFDVKVPPGSRHINLVCMDAGSRNILDLGNWCDAGFRLKGGVPK